MRKLFDVIGYTSDNTKVVGKLLYAKCYHKVTTYYIRTENREVIPCIKCVQK